MSGRLEDFIRNNREQFDDAEPADDLWQRIERGLPRQTDTKVHRKKKFPSGFVLRVAATIVVIITICFTGYIKLAASQVDLAAISPEYARQQARYASLVETKRLELKTIVKDDPQLNKNFNREFIRMDSVYKGLKGQLFASPDREKVLRAMIENLQIQTQILNQQLIMVEQYNKMKLAKNDVKNI